MPQIPLGTSDWGSENQQLSDIKMDNVYVAENPLSIDGMSRYVRPNLVNADTVGSGPIRGIWQSDGIFNGDFFIISGNEVYRKPVGQDEALLSGFVPGTDYVQIAGSIDKVVFVADGNAYQSSDGTSIQQIGMPDNQPVGSVAQLDSVFLLSIKDSIRFYYMNPGETAPDALSFASAERSPDPITSINILSDEIWFICTDSTEVWTSTGDQDIPYNRIAGRAYTDGCDDRDSVAECSYKGYPALIWVTNDGEVVLAQGSPNKVSNDSIEELLRRAGNLRAWTFRRKRCDFYVLTTDTETLVLNLDQGGWSRWYTYGQNNWQAHLGAQDSRTIYAGDKDTGQLYILDEGANDLNTLPIQAIVRGFVPSIGLQESVDSVNLRCNQGWSTSNFTPPVVELRWSDDYGFTWSDYFQAQMGTKGKYKTDITYRSLGLMERPGRLFEVSFRGLDKFRLDYATYNEV